MPSGPRSSRTTTSTGWRCPTCGRRFKNRDQAHSCASRSIDSFFADRAALRPVLDHLVAQLRKRGPIHIDASRSGINIAATSHFVGAKPVKDGLRVGFVLRRKLEHPRIIHHEFVGGARYVHRVLVKVKRDVDAELLGWLTEAYEMNVGAR